MQSDSHCHSAPTCPARLSSQHTDPPPEVHAIDFAFDLWACAHHHHGKEERRERKQSVVTLVGARRARNGRTLLLEAAAAQFSNAAWREGGKEAVADCPAVARGAVAAIRAAMIGHACRRRARKEFVHGHRVTLLLMAFKTRVRSLIPDLRESLIRTAE